MNRFEQCLDMCNSGFRNVLRRNIPEVKKLESLDDLKDLRLVKIDDYIPGLGDGLSLEYQASAPTLFPHVRQRLIDKGIAKPHNIECTSLENEGTPHEVYAVIIKFYRGRLEISLYVTKT